MWYVIQTVTGQEDVLTDMMQKIIPEEYYRECFYIKRECADKEGGGWRVYHSVLFPGYVFVVTEDLNHLYDSLKTVIGLTKLIGTGKEISIGDLARLIVATIGYRGRLQFDATKPDGTPRKLCDVTRLHSLGWCHKIEIEEGVKRLYQWYCQSINPSI